MCAAFDVVTGRLCLDLHQTVAQQRRKAEPGRRDMGRREEPGPEAGNANVWRR